MFRYLKLSLIVVFFSFACALSVRAQAPAGISYEDHRDELLKNYVLLRRDVDAAKTSAEKLALQQKLDALKLQLQQEYSREALVLEEFEMGDKLRALEIPLTESAIITTVTPIATLAVSSAERYPPDGFLIRRIAADRVEVWTAKEGWLLDGAGRVLRDAKVPRRDGTGRQWYGAFLPDGSWLTTDLWEKDKQLHFFDSQNRFQKSVPMAHMSGLAAEASQPEVDWARADRDGRGWIMQIGGDSEVSGFRYVAADGLTTRSLSASDVYARAYPRTLGPINRYQTRRMNDAGRLWLNRFIPGHGPGVEYPLYWLSDHYSAVMDDDTRDGEDLHRAGMFNVRGGEGNIGFWPGSSEVYVARTHDDRENAPHIQGIRPHDTLFYSSAGAFEGWLRAQRFADAADGKSMLFEAFDGSIITLGADRKVKGRCAFRFASGSDANAVVEMIFEDLQLGIFRGKDALVVGRIGSAQ